MQRKLIHQKFNLIALLSTIALLAYNQANGEKAITPQIDIPYFLTLKPSQAKYLLTNPINIFDYASTANFKKPKYTNLYIVLDTSGTMREKNQRMKFEVIETLMTICFKYCEYSELHILDSDGNKIISWNRKESIDQENEAKKALKSLSQYPVESGSCPLFGIIEAIKETKEHEGKSCIFVIGDEIRIKQVKRLPDLIEKSMNHPNIVINIVEIQTDPYIENGIMNDSTGIYRIRTFWRFILSMNLISKNTGGIYFTASN